jgi:hypothetical protein
LQDRHFHTSKATAFSLEGGGSLFPRSICIYQPHQVTTHKTNMNIFTVSTPNLKHKLFISGHVVLLHELYRGNSVPVCDEWRGVDWLKWRRLTIHVCHICWQYTQLRQEVVLPAPVAQLKKQPVLGLEIMHGYKQIHIINFLTVVNHKGSHCICATCTVILLYYNATYVMLRTFLISSFSWRMQPPDMPHSYENVK